MNKTYRSVWNEATGSWGAVSELAMANGKQKNMRSKSLNALATLGLGAVSALASGGTYASQLCTTDIAGGNQTAVSAASKSLISGCQRLPSATTGHDIGMLEAQSTMVYVDGTTGTVNFRATSTGPTLTINQAGNLLNLTAGAVTAVSKDAVNGSQLYGLAASVAKDLGGSTSVSSSGSLSAPTYRIAGKTYNDVGSALAALDASGGTDPLAVHYDNALKDSVTLGGSGAGAPVALHNVANAVLSASSLDAVNGSQLYDAIRAGTVHYVGINSNPELSNYNGEGARGPNSIAIGANAATTASQSVSLGYGAVASSTASVALGAGSIADSGYTVSVGNASTGTTRRITNVGPGADGSDAVNVDQMNAAISGNAANTLQAVNTRLNSVERTASSLQAAVLGANPGAAEAGAAALGAMQSSGTLVGAAVLSDTDAVHFDASDHSRVTLSSATGDNVSLSGLQAGVLSADSTDAVSGLQLYATNQQVAGINQALQNISVTGSTAVSANTTSGVATASGTQAVAIGGGAKASGASSTAIGDMANASASNAVALGANSVADRENSVSVGAAGSERQIVNVAAGTQETDAVNLNQLNNAMTQQSNAFNQQIGNLQNSINTVSKNAYAGVAAAMAMPNLTPSGPGRTVVAAGGGYYMGGSAAAVGVTYRSANTHWLVNGGLSLTSTGNMAARTQVGYEF